jgi:hypothetical protein
MSKKVNKKLVAEAVIALQLVTSIVGFTVSRADGPTAEEILLHQIYKIEGDSVNQKEAQKQILPLIQAYENTPQDGRTERMADALVQMNLYSQADTQSLLSDISVSSNRLAVQSPQSQQEASTALGNELNSIFAKHPASGAAFSGCSSGYKITAGVLIGGGFLSMMGDIVYGHQLAHGSGAWDTSAPVIYGSVVAVGVGVIMAIIAGNSNCGSN